MDPVDHQTFDIFSPLIPGVVVTICMVILLTYAFLNRKMPRGGGTIGRRVDNPPPLTVPDGFARVDCREVTYFDAPADAAAFDTLKAYQRDGVTPRQSRVLVHRVAGCNTRIECAAETPNYDRITPSEALALLRELPDPRLVYRLSLSDEPSFLDPWVRKVTGNNVRHLGHASASHLIVLYQPDRSFGRELGQTLLHEWLHLVAFTSEWTIRRFRRAGRVETLPLLPYEPYGDRHPKSIAYEAWSDLGEKILGYDEADARKLALSAPVHTMILWRRIEKIMCKVPASLRSTRAEDFKAMAAFVRLEVAPRARAAQAHNRWWRRLLRRGPSGARQHREARAE